MKKYFQTLFSVLQVDACAFGLFLAFMFCLVFCSACVNGVNPEVSFADRDIIERTEESWKMAFHSWSYDEDCFHNVSVATPSRDNFAFRCGKPAFFTVGCVQERGVGYGRGKVLYLSPAVSPHDRDLALIHVALHALASCSAKDGSKDPTDEAHMRPDIWIESAGNKSLEAHIRGGVQLRDSM